MNKTVLAPMVAFCVLGVSEPDKSPREILEYLDLSVESQPVEMIFKISKLNQGDTRRFTLKDDGISRNVLYFHDSRQKGQKILTTENGLWFISDRTRKAIKIPAIQKLFGDASIGDVSRLRFSQDYVVESTAVQEGDGATGSLILKLRSKQSSATYHRITLSVDGSTFLPQEAELYAPSGKHMKTVIYRTIELYRNKPMIQEWDILDPGVEGEITRLTIEKIEPIEAKPIEFTRKYLQLVR